MEPAGKGKKRRLQATAESWYGTKGKRAAAKKKKWDLRTKIDDENDSCEEKQINVRRLWDALAQHRAQVNLTQTGKHLLKENAIKEKLYKEVCELAQNVPFIVELAHRGPPSLDSRSLHTKSPFHVSHRVGTGRRHVFDPSGPESDSGQNARRRPAQGVPSVRCSGQKNLTRVRRLSTMV